MNETGGNPAGFWIRVGAYLLDGVVLSLAMQPFTALMTKSLNESSISTGDDFTSIDWSIVISIFLISLFIQLAYFVAMESSAMRGTLGKFLLNIEVVREDGQTIRKGQAVGRYFARILSAFFCVGYIMIAVRSDKRSLHDLLVKTEVRHK